MKKILNILFSVFVIACIVSCGSTKVEEKTTAKAKSAEDKNEYNEPDMAAYAEFINKLAIENNIGTFLWDCSTHIDRKTLSIKFPAYIDAIINCYPKVEDYGNSGDDSVFEEETSFEAVANFRAGWNLGNTLDATSYNVVNAEKGEVGWILLYGKKDASGRYLPEDWETAWGQPKTNKYIADFVLEAGFNAIRIPVTWAEHLDENDNVDKLWMARVKETVDYFYNQGVYCIVNVHHDGGGDGWIKATQKSYNKYGGRFEKLWKQIAETFRDYDERLLFESMNEALDADHSWNPPTTDASKWINAYNQLFVDTVRSTGGNNAKRNLVVMTYAGGGAAGNFNKFVIPADSVKDHIILEVHNYDPTTFTWTTVTWANMTARWKPDYHGNILKKEFAVYKEYAEKLGVPIIVGEYNADPKKYSDYGKF